MMPRITQGVGCYYLAYLSAICSVLVRYLFGQEADKYQTSKLPSLNQWLGEVDGIPALMADLMAGGMQYEERLWLFTAEQETKGMPRVRFSRSEVFWQRDYNANSKLMLKGEEFANSMKGWALVRVLGDQCSPQTIITNCTLYQQYTTDEALQAAAKSYGGLTRSLRG